MSPEPMPLSGTCFGLIADAHIHSGQTPPLPEGLPTTFRDCDGIVVLGDMGEPSGLDFLERIAPVHGVLGVDDVRNDPRLSDERRVFLIGDLIAGAVFDGVKHGLFSCADPLVLEKDFTDAVVRTFGRELDVLLCASTHKAFVACAAGVLIVNPGSPTLADAKSVALLHVADGLARVDIAPV